VHLRQAAANALRSGPVTRAIPECVMPAAFKPRVSSQRSWLTTNLARGCAVTSSSSTKPTQGLNAAASPCRSRRSHWRHYVLPTANRTTLVPNTGNRPNRDVSLTTPAITGRRIACAKEAILNRSAHRLVRGGAHVTMNLELTAGGFCGALIVHKAREMVNAAISGSGARAIESAEAN
jgi:hypothetical protein